MNKTLKNTLQYLGMLTLTAGLLWLSLKSIPSVEGENKSEFIWQTWQKSNKWYLMMMALVAILSHILRAYRWKMLLLPTGNRVSLSNSFLSVMIGYLVNLVIPRGGEISRCYNLHKLEKTPVEISFGTVVAERMVDLVCLILLIIISFFVEWDKLMAFVNALPISIGEGKTIYKLLLFGFIIIGGIAAAIYIFRKSQKLKNIVIGFKDGLLSIFKLDRPVTFVGASLLIWCLYFVTSYLVLIAFPETRQLELSAVITLFAMGAIAMAVPLPGGAGSYHTIVPLGMVMLYNLPKGDAVAFVFIFHAWQTFIFIVGGIVSLIISYWIVRWRR